MSRLKEKEMNKKEKEIEQFLENILCSNCTAIPSTIDVYFSDLDDDIQDELIGNVCVDPDSHRRFGNSDKVGEISIGETCYETCSAFRLLKKLILGGKLSKALLIKYESKNDW